MFLEVNVLTEGSLRMNWLSNSKGASSLLLDPTFPTRIQTSTNKIMRIYENRNKNPFLNSQTLECLKGEKMTRNNHCVVSHKHCCTYKFRFMIMEFYLTIIMEIMEFLFNDRP